MKLKHFIKLSALLLLCCFTLISKGKSRVQKYQHTGATLSVKSFKPNNLPVNAKLSFNLFESNQVITPQLHKTVHTVHIAYLAAYNFITCIKCLNFFSGNNNQGHSLPKTALLFPFHAFW